MGSSWAGKRSENEDDEKRAFSSWAGKRSDDEGKRAFSSWAGKRSLSDDEKRAFSSWAGKRSAELDNDALLMKLNPGMSLPGGGSRHKRSPIYGPLLLSLLADDYDKLSNDIQMAKKSFSAWAGKRGDMAETLSYPDRKRAHAGSDITMDSEVLAHLMSKPWREGQDWAK